MPNEQDADVAALATEVEDARDGRFLVTGGARAPRSHELSSCTAPVWPARAALPVRAGFASAPTPECVGRARRAVEAVCVQVGANSFAPVLVASELVTNAVQIAQFAGGSVEFAVTVEDTVLHIEVSDQAVDVPVDVATIDSPADDQENGRGLLIAETLSDALEVVVCAHRKTICARFELEPAT